MPNASSGDGSTVFEKPALKVGEAIPIRSLVNSDGIPLIESQIGLGEEQVEIKPFSKNGERYFTETSLLLTYPFCHAFSKSSLGVHSELPIVAN